MPKNAEQHRTAEEIVHNTLARMKLWATTNPTDYKYIQHDQDLFKAVLKSYASQECEKQNEALEKSVKLQSHYVVLLNGYDGGKRKQFKTAQEWIDRLKFIATAISTSEKGEG